MQHALLIIAEAAKHIPPDLKASEPSVPWRQIHGLGNMLRHEYRRIDPVVLWSVITEHLAPLDAAAAALLDRVPDK
ncbi:HepT-like ribonuclease domain-containing protein [Methylobacterium tarhaniae]|uniref:HepT-like ribonuclease domain-containing protein n=1 Tax=Methylobacterium tarhaniae TaxID=1187852 RepID=UPI0009F85551|nr:HepT-like ribonuclease domain-containing protein [Methylobacterium tarhaniae]